MRWFSIVLAVSCLTSFLFACSTSSSDDANEEPLSILFTGDVLLDRGVRPIAEARGIGYLFEQVEPFFRKADAVVINLEVPITDTLSPVNKKFVFRADSRWTPDLRQVGITHAAMANNHTVDQGVSGLQATYRHLMEAGITPLGYGISTARQLKPNVLTKGNQRVAIFNAITMPIENWHHTDEGPGICQPSADQLTEAIQHYHASWPDVRIVVVLHWGVEFQAQPSIGQCMLAARLAESGADAIIGHHPHVLQPIDTLGQSFVFYSLGNFVFDQHPPMTREGMMVNLHFHSDASITYDTIRVQIKNNRPTL